MSVFQKIILQCDRCGLEEDFEYQHLLVRFKAEKFWIQIIDEDGYEIDLCKECSEKEKPLQSSH